MRKLCGVHVIQAMALALFLALGSAAIASPTDKSAAPPAPGTPSFDCAAATTRIEHALCANPELGDLDRQVNEAYHAVTAVPAWSDWQGTEQADWVKQRDTCAASAPANLDHCLKVVYEVRLDEVEFMAEPGAAETPAGRLAGLWRLKQPDGGRTMAMIIHAASPDGLRLYVGGFDHDSPLHVCAFAGDATVDGTDFLNFTEADPDDPVTGKITAQTIDLNGGATTYCSWATSFAGSYTRDARL